MSEFIERYYNSPVRSENMTNKKHFSIKKVWKSAFDVVVSEHFTGRLRNPQRSSGQSAKMLTRIATMVALNVTGRAAFFMFSDFKPVYAITIISGITLGSLGGFLTGALTMLVSNFLFGQGPWTPWQMLALGLIGFISGALAENGLIPRKRVWISLYGFIMAIVVYGGIMNPAAMFMSVARPTWKLLLAYYISGIPVDLVKGTATFLFLWIGTKSVLGKIERAW